MVLKDWWHRRSLWEQALLIAVPGIGIGAGLSRLMRPIVWPSSPNKYTPIQELPGLLDYESEDAPEPEPPGIQYDAYDTPCVSPHPDSVAFYQERSGDEEFCTPPADLEPRRQTEVEFAEGGLRPKWPLDTTVNRKLQVSYEDVRGLWHGRWGRHFGAPRNREGGGKRVHVAVDLFASPGDVVLATEPGEIIAALPFYKATSAVYVKTDSGLIVNYGELTPRSWREFGIKDGVGTGQRIEAGAPLGRVGLSNDGSFMLHIETYDPESTTVDKIRKGEMQWNKGEDPPLGILDPTRYLVRAQRVKREEMEHLV